VSTPTSTQRSTPVERLPASQRREQTLAAASAVFARQGYHGATTERIAQAAGISQPYVVRMFGSKETLFLAVVEQCLDTVLDAFQSALIAEEPRSVGARLGGAYRDLAQADGVHLIVMQAYVLGADPVIGPVARAGFARILSFLIEDAGMSNREAEQFLAQGMLINTLLGLRLQEHPGTHVTQLVESVLA